MQEIILVLLLIAIFQLSYIMLKVTTTPRLKSRGRHPIYIDTSVLMDGRIATAAQTGFIPANLVVPRSVISELQLLADAADGEKRIKARSGLDMVTQLQEMDGVDVSVLNDGLVGEGGVDERLRQLAKQHNGAICTIDFNLNKAAKAEGIRVLNINELAGNLRMAYLPGEKVSLELVQKGNDSHQAVGYLSDGTMVVVEQASSDIGKTVEVEFIRGLQTAAGRMMFAKKIMKNAAKRSRQKTSSRNKRRNSEENLVDLANQ